MRLGLLADIHEEVNHLRWAIAALRDRGVDQFVVLGDIFETGRRIDETVELLCPLNSCGVWGNHDFGLCRQVSERIRNRYSQQTLKYFATLQPRIEIQGYRFQHIEPFLDPEQLEDLWWYGGDGFLDSHRSFQACSSSRMFMGHVHRWEAIVPERNLAWNGIVKLKLDGGTRYLFAIHAVAQGHCAVFDTELDSLEPISLDQGSTMSNE